MSADALVAMGAPQTSKVFLFLIAITLLDSTDTEQTYHFVNDKTAIVRGENTYHALAFDIILPAEGDNIQEAQLVLDAVDLVMIQALRGATEAPKVTFMLVLADAPNGDPEAGPFNFEMSSFNYNKSTINCTLSYGKHLEAVYPKVGITPFYFPGLF